MEKQKSYKYQQIARDNPFYSMTSNGRISEHRLVMAQHLGRCLSRKELVHHIDNNPRNNNLSNLQLLSYKDHELITEWNGLKHSIIYLRSSVEKVEVRLQELEALLKKKLLIG